MVENMEDMWKVSKLQRERKRREEQAAAIRDARAAKADAQKTAAAAAVEKDPPMSTSTSELVSGAGNQTFILKDEALSGGFSMMWKSPSIGSCDYEFV